MGHQPQRAYAFASVGVAAAAWAAIATRLTFLATPSLSSMLLAFYEFGLITIVALVGSTFLSERLNRVVNLVVAPGLVAVGLRFIIVALG